MAGNHRLPAKTKGRDTVDAGDRSPSTTITDVGDGTSVVGGETYGKSETAADGTNDQPLTGGFATSSGTDER